MTVEAPLPRWFYRQIQALRAANFVDDEVHEYLEEHPNSVRGVFPRVAEDVKKMLGPDEWLRAKEAGYEVGQRNYNAMKVWWAKVEELRRDGVAEEDLPAPPLLENVAPLIDYKPCQRRADVYRHGDAVEPGVGRVRKAKSDYRGGYRPISYKAKDAEHSPREAEARVAEKVDGPVNAAEAERLVQLERIRREMCRRSLLQLIQTFEPDYDAGWAHQEIAQKLEQFLQDVVDRKSPRLMLFLPPRFGKSLQASQYFPAFALGNYPWIEIIASSYAVSLPIGFSRKIRALIRDSQEFRGIFPGLELDPDSQGAEAWKTTAGGGYIAAGVGGPITGKGGHVLIVDDPVKNWEEAESEGQREAVWNWYTSTLYTRQAPGAGILVIQTRWHDDDLSGRLIEQMNAAKEALDEDAEDWEVVSYPAIAVKDETHRKAGEALHPQRFDERALARIRKAVGERVWSALYQQNPTPEDGDYFQSRHFCGYKQAPPRQMMTIYMAWDLAITKNEENDPSVGFVVGVDSNDDWYVLDEIRGWWESDDLIDQVCDAIELWRPSCTWLEKEKITLALGPALEREIRRRKLSWAVIETVPPGRKDKIARARSMQGYMRRGKVFWPHEAPWFAKSRNEFLRFPNGKHDDRVDAAAYIFMMASELPAPQAPRGESGAKKWRERLSRLGSKFSSTNSHMAS